MLKNFEPSGRFYTIDQEGQYIGINNTMGEPVTVDFRKFEDCLAWLDNIELPEHERTPLLRNDYVEEYLSLMDEHNGAVGEFNSLVSQLNQVTDQLSQALSEMRVLRLTLSSTTMQENQD